MTIPATGPVELGGTAAYSIQKEFGGSHDTRLSEYYRGGATGYVDADNPLTRIATSGAQKFSNYRGASKYVPDCGQSSALSWEFRFSHTPNLMGPQASIPAPNRIQFYNRGGPITGALKGLSAWKTQNVPVGGFSLIYSTQRGQTPGLYVTIGSAAIPRTHSLKLTINLVNPITQNALGTFNASKTTLVGYYTVQAANGSWANTWWHLQPSGGDNIVAFFQAMSKQYAKNPTSAFMTVMYPSFKFPLTASFCIVPKTASNTTHFFKFPYTKPYVPPPPVADKTHPFLKFQTVSRTGSFSVHADDGSGGDVGLHVYVTVQWQHSSTTWKPGGDGGPSAGIAGVTNTLSVFSGRLTIPAKPPGTWYLWIGCSYRGAIGTPDARKLI